MSHDETPSVTSDVAAQTGDDAAELNRDQRLSMRPVLIGLAMVVLLLAVGLVLLRVFFAERIPDLTEERLQSAIELWAKQGPVSYDMDVELRGAQPGNVHMEVRDGLVTATKRNDRVPPKWTWDTWSVPGMFETLEQDLQIASNPEQEIQAAPGTKWWLRCEFDPQSGAPKVYHRQVTGDGPEVFWRITRFQPR